MFGHSHGYQPKASIAAPSETPISGTGGRKGSDINFVGDLQRLELKPGDKFVLTMPGVLSVEQHQRIQEAWQKFCGGDTDALGLLIIDGGAKLGVIAS